MKQIVLFAFVLLFAYTTQAALSGDRHPIAKLATSDC